MSAGVGGRVVRAVVVKEWVSLRRRWVSTVVVWAGLAVMVCASGLVRLARVPVDRTAAWDAFVVYAAVMASAVVTLSTLRFWQEKSGRTLDTLLALPASTRSIFVAKALFPTASGVAAGLGTAVVVQVAFVVGLGGPVMGLLAVVGLVALLVVLNGALALLNGYAMWCLSESAAKLVQVGIMALFAVAFASLALFDPQAATASPAGAFGTVAGVVGLLGLLAVIAVLRVDTERVVLNQPTC